MSSSDATLKLAVDLRLACQMVSRRVRFEGSREVAPHQFSVLVKLVDGPRGPAELAELEQVSKPSMSKTIGGLAGAGLVRCDHHPTDGRAKLVSLTDAGRDAVERTRSDRDNFMLHYLEGLDAGQRALLREAADLLAEMMRR